MICFLFRAERINKGLDLCQGVLLHIGPSMAGCYQSVSYRSPSSWFATASWAWAKKPALAFKTMAYS